MSELSPDARARYRYYSQTAGINRNYLISAIIGIAFLVSTQKQETRISKRIDLDVGEAKQAYKVTKNHQVKRVNKSIVENSKKWSSDLWLKNDAMVAQVQSAVNKHLSSTLTHRDVTKMFDYSNVRSQSVQAVKAMTASTIRLLRTETARATNKIAMTAFKAQQVAMVEMVVEPDVCPECDEIREQGPFNLDDAPDIPIHPNCRCSLIPYDGDVALSF